MTERANAVWERYFEHAYATLEHAVVSSTRETVGALLYVWSFFTLEAVFRALRFAASVYMLYALRHPSVFPDESAAFKNAAKGGGEGDGASDGGGGGGAGGRVRALSEALGDARECVRLDPDFVKGHYRLGQAPIAVGREGCERTPGWFMGLV